MSKSRRYNLGTCSQITYCYVVGFWRGWGLFHICKLWLILIVRMIADIVSTNLLHFNLKTIYSSVNYIWCIFSLLMQACKVPSSMWSKIGRLKRSVMPKLNKGSGIYGSGASPGIMSCIAGRLLCDTYLCSRDLLKEVCWVSMYILFEFLINTNFLTHFVYLGKLFFDPACKDAAEQRPEGDLSAWYPFLVPVFWDSSWIGRFYCDKNVLYVPFQFI